MDANLKEVLMPLTIMGSLGGSVYVFVKTYSDYIIKRKLIEKGLLNDDARALIQGEAPANRYSSLKWGLILFAAGLALILMEFIPVAPDSPLPYGLFAMLISAAFLVYYFIVKSKEQTGR
ncbi:MAG: hypothetical protein K1X47_03620 [Cyclobacteriaceae bacterium]|nr:hypothetical protein [Cyclobacteriaceae bacterium]